MGEEGKKQENIGRTIDIITQQRLPQEGVLLPFSISGVPFGCVPSNTFCLTLNPAPL